MFPGLTFGAVALFLPGCLALAPTGAAAQRWTTPAGVSRFATRARDGAHSPTPAANVLPVSTEGGGAAHRSPVIAGALGFLIPGAGHVYAGETRRGWTVFGATMLGAYFALTDGMPTSASVPGSVVFVGGWAFSVADGVLAANRFNRSHQKPMP